MEETKQKVLIKRAGTSRIGAQRLNSFARKFSKNTTLTAKNGRSPSKMSRASLNTSSKDNMEISYGSLNKIEANRQSADMTNMNESSVMDWEEKMLLTIFDRAESQSDFSDEENAEFDDTLASLNTCLKDDSIKARLPNDNYQLVKKNDLKRLRGEVKYMQYERQQKKKEIKKIKEKAQEKQGELSLTQTILKAVEKDEIKHKNRIEILKTEMISTQIENEFLQNSLSSARIDEVNTLNTIRALLKGHPDTLTRFEDSFRLVKNKFEIEKLKQEKNTEVDRMMSKISELELEQEALKIKIKNMEQYNVINKKGKY